MTCKVPGLFCSENAMTQRDWKVLMNLMIGSSVEIAPSMLETGGKRVLAAHGTLQKPRWSYKFKLQSLLPDAKFPLNLT